MRKIKISFEEFERRALSTLKDKYDLPAQSTPLYCQNYLAHDRSDGIPIMKDDLPDYVEIEII